MLIIYVLQLSLCAAGSCWVTSPWMECYWDQLKDRTLLNLTLPGSHNSGNIEGELGSGPLCTQDYRYDDFNTSASRVAAGGAVLEKNAFDRAFLPWNVNHNHSIADQLGLGIRWFHLKACWVPADDGAAISLATVYHQHRGYTAQSLDVILGEIIKFTTTHNKEFIAIGINNLANIDGGDRVALAELMVAKFEASKLKLVGAADLSSSSLATMHALNRRVVLFAAGVVPAVDGVLDSDAYLYERWDDVMASGNLQSSREFLVDDIRDYATRADGRFYVMQANPNNNDNATDEINMYTDIQAGGRSSLLAWEGEFLVDLGALVTTAAALSGNATINAISTDFLDLSNVVEVSLRQMGLVDGSRDFP
jgi:hypothetical protein